MEKLFLKNGITVEEKEVADLDSFCDFLLEKNKAFNLTAIREPAEVYEKHFLDSLMGREKFESSSLIEQRQRTNVYAVIVVCQFKSRKHSADQCTLARSRLAYYADKLIKR